MEELAYVAITDFSLTTSRTGDIIRDLFKRSSEGSRLELVVARMYCPSNEFIDDFCKTIVLPDKYRLTQERLKRYLGEYKNKNNRMMFLLFGGEEGIFDEIKRKVGPIPVKGLTGNTIRESQGIYREDAAGRMKVFEPAVYIASSKDNLEKELGVWADYAEKDGGLLEGKISWPHEIQFDYKKDEEIKILQEEIEKPVSKEDLKNNIEKTVVLIKPGNIYAESGKVGEIINHLSGLGRRLIGAKAVRMGVNQALGFYEEVEESLGYKYGEEKGKEEFRKLIKYMTGYDRYNISEKKELESGTETSLALVYEGPYIIRRVRKIVGETDPEKAEPGTIRAEYGEDIMRNGVHASDSKISANREINNLNIQGTLLPKRTNEFFGEETKEEKNAKQ